MPPLYRLVEVGIYSLLNFLPLMVLALYPFQGIGSLFQNSYCGTCCGSFTGADLLRLAGGIFQHQMQVC